GPGWRRDRKHRIRHRPERDVRRAKLEHGRGDSVRVNGSLERYAMDGIPRQLQPGDEAAVALGRDPHAVGGTPGDIRWHGAAQIEVPGEGAQSATDPSDARDAIRASIRVVLLTAAGRETTAISRGGVAAVHEKAPSVDHHLAVASTPVRLEFQSQLAVRARPQTAGTP